MKKVALLLLLPIGCFGATSSSNLEEEIRELRGRIEELERRLKEFEEKNGALVERIASEEKQAKQRKYEDAISKKTPQQILKHVVDLIGDGAFEEARGELQAFIKKDPDNIYCGWMMFEIGNTFFSEENYREAALWYMKAFKKNPKGCKAAETLYKLSLCFKSLKEKGKQKSIVDKMLKDYPGNFAKQAKKELN